METFIKSINYHEWSKFQKFLSGGPCCNFAFPQGECYGLFEGGELSQVCSMVWYTTVYKNSPFRHAAIPAIDRSSRSNEITFLNKNARLLARVSTLPEFRGKGYARHLIVETLPRLNVRYVECLTSHADIRRLLTLCGFVQKGGGGTPYIDYWLFDMTAANSFPPPKI